MSKAGSSGPHIYTRDELASIHQDVQDGKEDARKLIVIDNKVYDITDFVVDHPGGESVILTQEGRDASDVFHEMHPPSAYETLADFYIGDCEAKNINNTNGTAFAEEIRQFRDQLEKDGMFEASTLFYVYKVLSTLAICGAGLAILKYFGKTSSAAVWISAFIVGFFWQQCGWLAHDFGHYQVIKNPKINNFFLVTLGNLVQGFSLSWWKNKHNTHHASTNITGEDPDINTAPILLWDEVATANFYGGPKSKSTAGRFIAEHILPYQTRYYFFILALARLSWAIKSVTYSFENDTLNKSKWLSYCERVFLVIHWLFFTYVTIAWTKSWTDAAMFFVISQATTGYLLAIVFAMNHNGMPVLTPEQASKTEFYELQVITGRDVTSNAFGDFVMGGLNYQIEHHVFPEMPRHNLPIIKPRIKQLAQKYNIHYHDTSVIGGTLEVVKTLDITQKIAKKFSLKLH